MILLRKRVAGFYHHPLVGFALPELLGRLLELFRPNLYPRLPPHELIGP